MKNAEQGLTLIEIMIVLVILAIVMTFLGSRIFGAGDKAKAQITKMKMQQLQANIETYRLQYNTLPKRLEDLANCNNDTGSDCIPLVTDPEAFRDGWGNPFKYELDENGKKYKITSLGADGVSGGSGVDYDIYKIGP